LHEQVQLNAFSDNGGNSLYSVFRHDRFMSTGGGVLIAVSNTLRSNFVTSQSFGTCECLFVDTVMYDSTAPVTLRIGSVYRPPNASVEDSVNLFNYITETLESTKHFIIYGDFNLNDIDWVNFNATSNISKEFLNTCLKSGATQCVNFPTRNENILDLILCSDQNLIQEITCSEPFSLSDHNSISLQMQPLKKQFKQKVFKPSFKLADYALINSYLSAVDWDYVYSECVHANDYYNAFKGIIDYVVTNFVPVTCSKSSCSAPWFNDKMKHLKRIKQRHWKRYMQNKNIVKYARYQESASVFKSELFKAKCDYERNLFENKTKNSKKFYNYIRKQTTVCSSIPCLKDGEAMATTDKEKAEVFSNYFANVFVKDNDVIPDFQVECVNSMSSFSSDVRSIIKIAKKLKLSSSPGPDKIPTLFFEKH
jgi:hypothetical protein